ncbi:hypothetical protein L1987_17454 [Smallanthus sonchifolius]|uniref:Uncharacterized protein n=1 Tax=Smallanthus sonchifolius TaxID=185202 RepID=A0ACB9J0F7_9ASTR|nr:hypothetical protein L1987_17454 [Smallanthus sonchifolius]
MTSTETWEQYSVLDQDFQILIQSFGSSDLQLEVAFSIRQKTAPDRSLQISGYLTAGKNIHYMDYRPGSEDVSLENVRESLIAISYQVLKYENNNNVVVVSAETKAIDELRSKLMSIASYVPSMVRFKVSII